MQLIPDDSIDCIIVDPPYGVDFNNKFYNDSKEYVFGQIEKWFIEWKRVLKKHCHIYIFIPTLEVDKWVGVTKVYFEFNNLVSTQIYCNNIAYLPNNFRFDLQLVIYASNSNANNFNYVTSFITSDSWKNDNRNKNKGRDYTFSYTSVIRKPYSNIKANDVIKREHPNEKNPEFIKTLIELSTKTGDIVLDSTAGSGSTAKACKITNRNYIVNDKDKLCYDKMLRSLQGVSMMGINTSKIIY